MNSKKILCEYIRQILKEHKPSRKTSKLSGQIENFLNAIVKREVEKSDGTSEEDAIKANAQALRGAMQQLKLKRLSGDVETGQIENISKTGTSRVVYDAGRVVIKVAINPAGVAQNKKETDVTTSPSLLNQEFLANVVSIGDGFSWIAAEKVIPLTSEKEFEDLTKVKWTTFIEKVCGETKAGEEKAPIDVSKPGRPSAIRKKELESPAFKEKRKQKAKFLQKWQNMVKSFGLSRGDVCKIESLGRIGNDLVIFDYGLDRQIWEKFYQPISADGKTFKP